MTGIWRAMPFRRAPLLLARHPSVAGAVAGAAAVLALTGAAAPLFVASAASASVNDQVAARCAYVLGMAAYGPTEDAGQRPPGNPRADFDRLADRIPNLGPTEVVTIFGGTVNPVSVTSARGPGEFPVTLLQRPDQEHHITIVSDAHTDGLLLPDGLAGVLKVKAGDRVRISSADSAPVRVAGVYRDLNSEPKRAYWCDPVLNAYSRGLLDENPPPPLVLARGPVAMAALARSHTAVTPLYERPVLGGLTLPEGRRTAAALPVVQNLLRTNYLTDRGQRERPFLWRTHAVADLPFIVRRADAVASSLAATCAAIAAAGSVVALLLLGGAGLLWVERRRTEVRLLWARGVGPAALGLKALAEMLPALLVGAVAGWGLALWLVPAVGPSDVLPPSTASSAAVRTGLVALAGAVTLAVVAAVAIRRSTERPLGRHRSRLAAVPWEVGLLVAAWLVAASITDRGLPTFADTTVPRLDAAQLLYPLLLLSGGTLLAARLLVLVLRRRRTRPSRLTGAAYLAGRRLSGAPGVTAVLVVAAALSIGVLTFATAMTGTLRYTVDTKARIFVGSDAQVTLVRPVGTLPPALRTGTTTVVATDADVAGAGHVDVLGIDPTTFASAAAWDTRLGGPLAPLVRRLDVPAGGGPVPAIVVGDLPSGFTLPLAASGGQTVRLPVHVVARPHAFPQQHGDALVVVPQARLPRGARDLSATELWVRDWDAGKQAALAAAGVQIRFVTTVADVSRAPDLAAVTWTYGFFESLGALTGVIAIGGLLLYLATRQRSRALGYGLTRRMGLRRPAHALSVLLEVGAGLLAGYAVGTALGTLGVQVVYAHLDPEQELPPGPLLHLPLAAYAALAAATLLVALGATALAQHTADRTRTADLLRLGAA